MLLAAIDPGRHTAIVVARIGIDMRKTEKAAIYRSLTLQELSKAILEVQSILIDYPDLDAVVIERPPTLNLDKELRSSWEIIFQNLKEHMPEETVCVVSPGTWKPFTGHLPKSTFVFKSQHERDAYDMIRWYSWSLGVKNARK